MTLRVLTVLIMIGATALVLLYDLAVFLLFGREATISVVVFDASCRYPIIPWAIGFGMGLFVGHVFWPMFHPPLR